MFKGTRRLFCDLFAVSPRVRLVLSPPMHVYARKILPLHVLSRYGYVRVLYVNISNKVSNKKEVPRPIILCL